MDRETPHYVGTTSLAQTSLNSLGKTRLPVGDMTALCLRSTRCMYDTAEKGEELIFTLHHTATSAHVVLFSYGFPAA